MDYKKFNEALKDLEMFRHSNPLIERTTEYEMDDSYGDGIQGESNIYHEIYKWDDEMFIRLTINTDSYGCNEFVNGIAFVKPIQKTISSFEPVN